MKRTVPKKARETLVVGTSDVLNREIAGKEVRVSPASHAFLRLRGSIKVGPGNAVKDVRRARKLRGTLKP